MISEIVFVILLNLNVLVCNKVTISSPELIYSQLN